jgi:hypothetical protein
MVSASKEICGQGAMSPDSAVEFVPRVREERACRSEDTQPCSFKAIFVFCTPFA